MELQQPTQLKKHINPNGHPFTLNISTQIEDSGAYIGYDGLSIDANIPIASWFTIKGGFFYDRYLGEKFKINKSSSYNTDITSGDSITLEHLETKSFSVFHFGFETHLPIYKLWEK